MRKLVAQFALALGLLAALSATSPAQDANTSSKFMGLKANSGTVTHAMMDGKSVLTLSDDFVVPDAPDVHWQVVDSSGTTYVLERLKTKPDKINKSITLPPYVKDVAKVQMWCAFAETVLGEASFSMPVK